ncbi:hypothetical protein P171DRAFT_486599 [Karstenula rhodostoma CBS 690.94]|uniref:Uncharacterized protein n=1 Tax=Karstenula rhodostoma CBS 690.94 TaxID=1392251 RepID=A0A9P4UC91_9PLEO|nr:hypothetical protein P171DRAFT_486599 [Karstenula rhodostoma CBS 690.94]
MLGEKYPQTLTESLVNTSDAHIHGHLVSTGFYNEDKVPQLFVHLSKRSIDNHDCLVYSELEDLGKQGIRGDPWKPSADVIIEEHGWFRDIEVFMQICKTHPTPQGGPGEKIFVKWRDTLLEHLDAQYSGGLWTKAN